MHRNSAPEALAVQCRTYTTSEKIAAARIAHQAILLMFTLSFCHKTLLPKTTGNPGQTSSRKPTMLHLHHIFAEVKLITLPARRMKIILFPEQGVVHTAGDLHQMTGRDRPFRVRLRGQ